MTCAPRRTCVAPRVFTVPPGKRFIDCFVEGFLSGAVLDAAPLTPENLAAACIFVPTRRAGDALTAAFAAAAPAGATLLPRIIPLGDEAALDDAAFEALLPPEERTDPPAIGDLDRRLALFSLVDAWRQALAAERDEHGAREPFYVGSSRSDAFALAADLARLIDETIIEDVPLARLAEAMPEDYDPGRHDAYWSMTQEFLAIAARHWPERLVELDMLDGAERLKRRFRRLARQLSAASSPSPMVIAGSTGSVAATADLMAAVSRLPMGAVVLPGLDLALDEPSWSLIASEQADLATRYAHPQTQLKRTLERIGIGRADVRRLPLAGAPSARERLASDMFRPAETTAAWQAAALAGAEAQAAVAGLSLIEAADEQEEALAIALALRETLETPGRNATLVTADPALSRRVQAELMRWDIAVEDSAGLPLALTPVAVLARLALRACAEDAAGVDLLALLRHPLAGIGQSIESRDRLLPVIEIAGLRGRAVGGDSARLAAGLAAASRTTPGPRDPRPLRRLSPDAMAEAAAHAARLDAALAAFKAAFAAGVATLRAAAAAHRALVDALLAGPEGAVWPEDQAARLLAGLFLRLTDGRFEGPEVSLGDYTGIFEQLAAEATLRRPGGGHPRLSIRGLLEARLIDADRIVLGGLNDGGWPPDARSDPFLNRPMRMALGLQPPERRVGQTAHDFMMLLGGGDVVLTRAAKQDGQPAVASRFLRRLTAFLGPEGEAAMRRRGAPYQEWARRLDAPAAVRPVERPAPKIPPALMPARLNLTEIETLYRDPYSLFARHVLGLDALDPLDPEISARDRGTAIHQALADYVKATADTLPQDGAALLIALGREAFATLERQAPEAVSFWWRRFEAFVPWFVEWDRQQRAGGGRLLIEAPGRLALNLAKGHRLTLSARADRIGIGPDGALSITDYKTGTPPSSKVVLLGLAPQLPLTAALAARGGFADLGPARLDGLSLSYLSVGKARGEGKETAIKPAKADAFTLAEAVEQQFRQLENHLNQYLAGMRGFASRRMPQKTSYASDYDHLARVLEWSYGGAEDEEAGEEGE